MKEGKLVEQRIVTEIWSECPVCGESNKTERYPANVTPRYIYVSCGDCTLKYKVEII